MWREHSTRKKNIFLIEIIGNLISVDGRKTEIDFLSSTKINLEVFYVLLMYLNNA